MNGGEAAGSRPLLRRWLTALGRIALFWLLFLLLAQVFGVLLSPLGGAGARGLAVGGVAWLAAAVLAGGALLTRLDGRSWWALGFAPTRRVPAELGAGFGFGAVLMLIAVAPMVVGGLLRFGSDAGDFADWAAAQLSGLVMLAAPAAAEEAVFRGYPLQVLARAGGMPFAVVVTSIAFAAVHTGNPEVGPLAIANIFVAGVMLALVYVRTRSLWAATAAHLGWNWTMAVLLDLPVSGLTWLDTPLYQPWVHGARWVTGGPFGPEGGVVGSAALLIGCALLARTRSRAAPARTAADLPLDVVAAPESETGIETGE